MKPCKQCGTDFVATREMRMYCSKECFTKYYAGRNLVNTRLTLTCPECQTTFEAKTKKKVYCSKPCYKKGNLKMFFKKNPNKRREYNSKNLERVNANPELRAKYSARSLGNYRKRMKTDAAFRETWRKNSLKKKYQMNDGMVTQRFEQIDAGRLHLEVFSKYALFPRDILNKVLDTPYDAQPSLADTLYAALPESKRNNA